MIDFEDTPIGDHLLQRIERLHDVIDEIQTDADTAIRQVEGQIDELQAEWDQLKEDYEDQLEYKI